MSLEGPQLITPCAPQAGALLTIHDARPEKRARASKLLAKCCGMFVFALSPPTQYEYPACVHYVEAEREEFTLYVSCNLIDKNGLETSRDETSPLIQVCLEVSSCFVELVTKMQERL